MNQKNSDTMIDVTSEIKGNTLEVEGNRCEINEKKLLMAMDLVDQAMLFAQEIGSEQDKQRWRDLWDKQK